MEPLKIPLKAQAEEPNLKIVVLSVRYNKKQGSSPKDNFVRLRIRRFN